ncbi:hypothetical protein EVAR_71637_1 [Eumeta japonica]|uniref:Uncharacterized protein n=1 Tax=Eumeta variegata TaxID=151549 RepID=A0A4C1T4Y7_EUMVA|nr:hypothetical protein EVAR_71637_1 [Eumeta japonica]
MLLPDLGEALWGVSWWLWLLPKSRGEFFELGVELHCNHSSLGVLDRLWTRVLPCMGALKPTECSAGCRCWPIQGLIFCLLASNYWLSIRSLWKARSADWELSQTLNEGSISDPEQ